MKVDNNFNKYLKTSLFYEKLPHKRFIKDTNFAYEVL